ncbi:hypothetical protein HGRIS_003805 [Hohenbuehelia grisea]|uniref:Uncharacterized protein n=1 Tax=Hohenbuehelia grisea TaxID=104357 RepID=A0ABR3JGL4_9AGAR
MFLSIWKKIQRRIRPPPRRVHKLSPEMRIEVMGFSGDKPSNPDEVLRRIGSILGAPGMRWCITGDILRVPKLLGVCLMQ